MAELKQRHSERSDGILIGLSIIALDGAAIMAAASRSVSYWPETEPA